MSDITLIATPERQVALERFYYREARLLDSRSGAEDVCRKLVDAANDAGGSDNTTVDNRERGQESMIGVDRELEGSDSLGCPIREESYVHLMVRVERAYKINSWSENPPARTRRIIGNVELVGQDEKTLSVLSNFHLHYARPGSDNALYCGQRRDILEEIADGYVIRHREVILDYSDIELPTLGLLF